jgi:hypothetical protein
MLSLGYLYDVNVCVWLHCYTIVKREELREYVYVYFTRRKLFDRNGSEMGAYIRVFTSILNHLIVI